MFVDSAEVMETELATFLRSRRWLTPRPARDPEYAARRAPLVTKKVLQQIHELEQLLSAAGRPTTPVLHSVMETLRNYLDDLIDVVASSGEWSPEDEIALGAEALEYVRAFQRLLNDAGFTLTLDYLSTLVRSTALPHEAFNTLRRLFLKIRFDAARSPPHAQARLVLALDEALEQNPDRGTRLPASIINIVLGLAGSALDDPGCAMKARGAVNHYLNALPPGSVTHDEALKALERLDGVLPMDARAPPSTHLYANTKIERRRTVTEAPTLGRDSILSKVG
jgi:hypothetical protein